MSISKIAAAGTIALFLSAALLPGQSVVELAKKEKERREALKGKTGTVVTNADLAKTKKKPALELPPETQTPPGEAPPQPSTAAPQGAGALPAPLGEERAAQAQRLEEQKTDAESRLKGVQELISLLKLKMTALQQQFYNFSSTTPREQIQREISETSLKLQEAQAEETKIREELGRLNSGGPAALPPIR
jgi:DNA repair exonuclease SbcCD ATPase subunit